MLNRLKDINILPFLYGLVVLMILDIATTCYGLDMGLIEVNPLFEYQTVTGKIGWTYLAVLLYGIIDYQSRKEGSVIVQKLNSFLVVGISLMYVVVVVNNFWNLLTVVMGKF